jgi:hypothetical protein
MMKKKIATAQGNIFCFKWQINFLSSIIRVSYGCEENQLVRKIILPDFAGIVNVSVCQLLENL